MHLCRERKSVEVGNVWKKPLAEKGIGVERANGMNSSALEGDTKWLQMV